MGDDSAIALSAVQTVPELHELLVAHPGKLCIRLRDASGTFTGQLELYHLDDGLGGPMLVVVMGDSFISAVQRAWLEESFYLAIGQQGSKARLHSPVGGPNLWSFDPGEDCRRITGEAGLRETVRLLAGSSTVEYTACVCVYNFSTPFILLVSATIEGDTLWFTVTDKMVETVRERTRRHLRVTIGCRCD